MVFDKNLVRHRRDDGAARSPTRRRLLTLLASLSTAAASISAVALAVPSASSASVPVPDPIPDLFAVFETLLTRHEAALWRCDRLEAFLLAELEPPRVRLPVPAGYPVHYADTDATIIHYVPPGRSRWRLQAILLRRQHAWMRGARACGLTQAQEQETTLDAAVRDAAATLLATPVTTLAGIRTKILVLLATREPGGAFRDASPWGELRAILADVDRLAHPA